VTIKMTLPLLSLRESVLMHYFRCSMHMIIVIILFLYQN